MPAPLLTAHDASGHVHLVAGTNSLANARCAKSIEAGASVFIFAAEDVILHPALQSKVEEGTVLRVKRDFRDEDLKTLGRDEVDNVVDAVFVTLGAKNTLS